MSDKRWSTKLNIILLALLFVLGCAACKEPEPSDASPSASTPVQSENIGPDVAEDQFSAMKGLKTGNTYKNSFFCFSVLLDSNWVVEEESIHGSEYSENSAEPYSISDFFATDNSSGVSLDITLYRAENPDHCAKYDLEAYGKIVAASIQDTGLYQDVDCKTIELAVNGKDISALKIVGSVKKEAGTVTTCTTQMLIVKDNSLCIISVSSCDEDKTEDVIREIFSFGEGA